MTLGEVEDSLCALIQRYATQNNITVKWEDTAGDIPAGQTVWLRVTLRVASSKQGSLSDNVGKRLWTTQGVLMVQVFAPSGSGATTGGTIAEGLVGVLRNYSDGSLWLRNVMSTRIGASGAFFQHNVTASFTCDDRG